MTRTSTRWAAAAALACMALGGAAAAAQPDASAIWSARHDERAPEDEVVYFLLPDRFENGDPRNDRGGLRGDRLVTGFDPSDTGFYQGGDLKGLIKRLDYVQSLGATAVWVAPIFRNKPVQGQGTPHVSAGYHGYWITDFLDVDPHFGTRADFKALVEAAHARGMKVYMDIILNHTADVIAYRECHDPAVAGEALGKPCAYRSVADYPWTRKGGVSGAPINDGFLGDDAPHLTAENFARFTRPDYAYTPFVKPAEARIKNPAWLNDPIHYHNRGETRFEGENSLYGDFAGLDDLMTNHPRVIEGMIEVYKSWITDFRVDGFRVDTVKHVRPEMWQAFVPAILEHAKKEGIEHFYVFAEVYAFEPQQLARYTLKDRLPTVLDFAFQSAVADYVIHGKPARRFEGLFDADVVYDGGERAALRLATFLGNHDMGRFAGFLRAAHPTMSEADQLARLKLANALMFLARGVPVVYYGDEQGFSSDGNDRAARETLFPSRTASYLDNDLVGTDRTHAVETFDRDHPLYRQIAELSRLRRENVALRRGAQIVRHTDEKGGVFAFSRIAPNGPGELLAVFNAEAAPRTLNVKVDPQSADWETLAGACPAASSAPGSVSITVPAMDFVLCRAKARP